jgi:transposase
MKKNLFTPLHELQLPSHCGPCSLSAGLFILGISATQRQLAKAAGRPLRAFVEGVDEKGLRKAARNYGVKSEFLLIKKALRGREFVSRLRSHLRAGNPAILLVRNFEHWVAVIGYLRKKRKFIVADPKDKTHLFLRWSDATLLRRAWNDSHKNRGAGEPSQFFAILLSRRYGSPAMWRITETWLRLCERGSMDTAESMVEDLTEIALRASSREKLIRDGPYLAEIMEEIEEPVIEGITHWAQGSGLADKGDLRAFYRDYKIVAVATGIRIAKDVDKAQFVAELTALLSSYWWGAEF